MNAAALSESTLSSRHGRRFRLECVVIDGSEVPSSCQMLHRKPCKARAQPVQIPF